MIEPQGAAVAALIERCTTGLAMSQYLYRDEWPDVGRAAREKLREQATAVLMATGIPLDLLAETAGICAVPQELGEASGAVASSPKVEARRWRWWWR